MDIDRASSFINSRTDQRPGIASRVNRNVNLVIYFKISPFEMPEYRPFTDAMIRRNYYPIIGIIDRIEVLDGWQKIGYLTMQ